MKTCMCSSKESSTTIFERFSFRGFRSCPGNTHGCKTPKHAVNAQSERSVPAAVQSRTKQAPCMALVNEAGNSCHFLQRFGCGGEDKDTRMRA